MYHVHYAKGVLEQDLPHILQPWKTEIRNAIEKKLAIKPMVYTRPFKRSFKGYRKLRVGEYRIVLRIEENNIVKIFVIQHRSIVYTTAPSRV